MPVFFDTHAHLDYPEFAGELPQLIARAKTAGIAKIIAVGTDLESSRRVLELSRQFAEVYAAVGWHPSDAEKAPADLRPALRELAGQAKVVAVGETGLDYHHLPSEKPGGSAADDAQYKQKQVEIFGQHLEVAAELGLNCIVHQRDAFEDVLTLMAPYQGRVRGVFHCFVNPAADLQRILAHGSLVSFTGIVTFKNAQNVRDTLSATPLDQLMLETDCPFLAPMPFRGKRCEPAYVKETAETVARIKGCSLEELSAATCASALRFFPKMG
jgi:TatD DNase family protein